MELLLSPTPPFTEIIFSTKFSVSIKNLHRDHLSSGLDSLPESKVDENEDGQRAEGETWFDGTQAIQD